MNHDARITRVFPQTQTTLSQAVDAFLAHCRSAGLSPNTVTYYRSRLKTFADYIGDTLLRDVTTSLVRDFLTSERERTSQTTACHSYTALSRFFDWSAAEGFLTENPMQNVQKPRRPKRVIRALSEKDVEAMLDTCRGRGFADVRNRALVLLLFDAGLRASELCSLRLGDVDWAAQTLFVVGKGDKERQVPFGQTTAQALRSYITRRGELDHDFLFVTTLGTPMNRNDVYRVVSAMGKNAGLSGVHPHQLRHSCAIAYLRRGGDPFTLQKLLGHSDLTMAKHYCQVADDDVVSTHRKASPADALKSKTTGGSVG